MLINNFKKLKNMNLNNNDKKNKSIKFLFFI